jgi:predicted transposase/invertase (TIGR01784 family)
MKNARQNHQDFDKIFKENLNEIIFSLTEELCGLKIEKFENISLVMQRTKEQRPDFAKIATDSSGRYVLHFEIQTANEKEMPWRMLEYFEFFYRKYEIPVRQFVLYIGKNKLSMLSDINLENLKFNFQIIDFQHLDYRTFINSKKPESIILAILCDYRSKKPESVISEILQHLADSETENLQKYIFQLKILSALRDLEEETVKEVENMPFNYDMTRDPHFRKGISEGISQGISEGISQGVAETKHSAVAELLKLSALSREQIAKALNVDIKFVEDIAKSLVKS